MSQSKAPRLRISIRVKLLLVASTLLIIPWVGSRYIQEMESFLRQQQEEALLTRTRLVAAVLQGHPELFATQGSAPLPTRDIQHVFIRPLRTPINLDGYLDDWSDYAERELAYTANNALKGSEQASLAFSYQPGTYGRHLYIAVRVRDDRIVYRAPNSLHLDQSDHLLLALTDRDEQLQHYVITTIAPGWVNAHQVTLEGNGMQPLRPEVRIKGEWQETTQGYNIEFRIPLDMLANKLGLAVADVDTTGRRQVDTLIASSNIYNEQQLATIMFPSLAAETLLERLQYPQTRSWVIDTHNRVIARVGMLSEESQGEFDEPSTAQQEHTLWSGLMTLFYKLILRQPSTEFHDELLNASRLDSAEFRRAIGGEAATRWRQTPDQQTSILTAAYPVYNGQQVIGAVAIEQTSNTILLLQNRAMEILFNLSALAFLLASIVLLAFASRLSARVRKLRNATREAIAADGRVVGTIKATRDRDEVGDLSRSVADMLERLAQYNRYLEGMAGKLSHELRTPITVVRSSLDNLHAHSDPQDVETYTQRAREGISRLDNILTRMSEATRLEQTLQSEQAVAFDLHKVVASCIDGYRLAHPELAIQFEVSPASADYTLSGAPELIAQMLDKLVNNAIDFHAPGTPILVGLSRDGRTIELRISNTGPTLPAHMQANLFESMVSVRDKKDEQAHLGLGLYIVRLICDYHHATAGARNRANGTGVEFIVTFPAQT